MVQLYNDTYGLCGSKPADSDATPDYHGGAWCAVLPALETEVEDVVEEDVEEEEQEEEEEEEEEEEDVVAANPTKAHRLLEFEYS